ncbi:MAG: HAMP domain-containing sensor histidine kinase [Lactimicrobium sp.]|jgi:signal transduction histidine kinase
MSKNKWVHRIAWVLMIVLFLCASVFVLVTHDSMSAYGSQVLINKQMNQDALDYVNAWRNDPASVKTWNNEGSNLEISLYTYENNDQNMSYVTGAYQGDRSTVNVNIMYDAFTDTTWYTNKTAPGDNQILYQVRMYLPSVLTAHDIYWRMTNFFRMDSWLSRNTIIGILSGIGTIALAIWLILISNFHWPRNSLDILVIMDILLGCMFVPFIKAYPMHAWVNNGRIVNLIIPVVYALVLFLAVVCTIMNLVSLVQRHRFSSDSAIGYVLSHLNTRIFVHPVFRGILYGILIALWVYYLLLSGYEEEKILFSFALLVPCIDALSLRHGMKVCEKAADEMAGGKTDWQIDEDTLRHVHGLSYQLAVKMNHLGSALDRAVEQRTKSQRLQSQLIANVSHDIRTPLTVITSYVDLLQKEHTPEEEKEYLQILDKQCRRLKRMSEDVLAASKAENGAVPVHLEKIQINELLCQAAGEYQDRFDKAGLTLCMDLPQDELEVSADGRLLWRIMGNLLDNACKYSLSSSRVYLQAGKKDDSVWIRVVNVSKAPLNMSADELMERFARGDVSRHSEGSGLGLSIVKSLVTLMHGSFGIHIDTDLFTAEVVLPEYEEKDELVEQSEQIS